MWADSPYLMRCVGYSILEIQRHLLQKHMNKEAVLDFPKTNQKNASLPHNGSHRPHRYVHLLKQPWQDVTALNAGLLSTWSTQEAFIPTMENTTLKTYERETIYVTLRRDGKHTAEQHETERSTWRHLPAHLLSTSSNNQLVISNDEENSTTI